MPNGRMHTGVSRADDLTGKGPVAGMRVRKLAADEQIQRECQETASDIFLNRHLSLRCTHPEDSRSRNKVEVIISYLGNMAGIRLGVC